MRSSAGVGVLVATAAGWDIGRSVKGDCAIPALHCEGSHGLSVGLSPGRFAGGQLGEAGGGWSGAESPLGE